MPRNPKNKPLKSPKPKKAPKLLKSHYSGPQAREFWQLVDSADPDATRGLYVMCCILQDVEHRVLHYLRERTK